MATRSRIGLQLADGNILSVYHHWDGYPEWLGVTLNKKFNTRDKVAELIDGGDISCCDSDSDWNLNKVENHVQYYNDRGENTEPRLDANFDEYVKNGEEYAYVFTLDHVWECYAIDRNYDDDYNVTDVNVKPATIPSEEAVA
tara:strand:- start:163 stop:588 length:426 start_codon:yes stop_codon:yes gene_type:complete